MSYSVSGSSPKSKKLLPAPKQLLLKVIKGEREGVIYRITSKRITIGRHESNDITLNDKRVSRQHAVIRFFDDQFFIEDISESNSIYVNQVKRKKAVLESKNILQIGQHEFLLKVVDPLEQRKENLPSSKGVKSFETKKIAFMAGPILVIALVYNFMFLGSVDNNQRGVTSEEVSHGSLSVNGDLEVSSTKDEEGEYIPSKLSFSETKAESHFIQGFRDYQKGHYSRAIASFETALTMDSMHEQSRRYKYLSEVKYDEMIVHFLQLASSQKGRGHYSDCVASYKNAMNLMNDQQDSKYQEARQGRNLCLSLKEGRRR